MVLTIFDYCDVAWNGCDKVNGDVLESLRHRAEKIISPNSCLDDKELNATLASE